jgi:hypothetical protein
MATRDRRRVLISRVQNTKKALLSTKCLEAIYIGQEVSKLWK